MTDDEWLHSDPWDDNGTIGATGAPYFRDNRTEEEKRRDDRRLARRRFIDRWTWRLRGLLPRGWEDEG